MPPHTIASLESRLISSEKIGTHYDFGLFQESGETILHDHDTIAALSDIHPGVNQVEPIASELLRRLGFSRSLMAIRESSE